MLLTENNYLFENQMDDRFRIETFIKVVYSNESQIHEYILLRDIKSNFFNVVCCHCYTQKPNFDEYQKSQELVHDILSGFPPEEHDEWFSTIQEAIQEHDLAFNNFYNDFVND